MSDLVERLRKEGNMCGITRTGDPALWEEAANEIERLREIENKASKTIDGKPIYDGDSAFLKPGTSSFNLYQYKGVAEMIFSLSAGYEGDVTPDQCYSTQELAEQASKETP